MDEEWIGNTFIGVFLPHKKKYYFPKFMAYPNTNLTAILFHSQCINCLNQLLEEINDWVRKKKWVVESLWVLSLTFVFTLLAQGFEYFPFLILVKSCPHLFVALHS